MGSDPTDAARWTEATKKFKINVPKLINLADIRKTDSAFTISATSATTKPALPPSPEGLSTEEYAEVLKVSAPDIFDPVSSWHIVFATWPDNELCYKILSEYRVETIGQWSAISSGDHVDTVKANIGEHRMAWLETRIKLLDSLRHSMGVGRGKPFTRTDAANCPAIERAKYRETILELATTVNGNPKAFRESLDSISRAKIRSNTIDKIRDWLVEEGFIDESPTLSDSEVIVIAETNLNNLLNDGLIKRAEIRKTLDWLKKFIK